MPAAWIDHRSTGIDARDDIVALQNRAWQSPAELAVGQRRELGLYAPDAFVPNVGRGLSLVPAAALGAPLHDFLIDYRRRIGEKLGSDAGERT